MGIWFPSACQKCGREMRVVATIQPVGGHDPGLVAFMCTNCGATKYEVVPTPRSVAANDRPTPTILKIEGTRRA
jgi:hypothetical protein